MATGIKRDFSNSMIPLSANVDARSSTPLFHVQAKGCPSMAQMKMGFFSFAAIFWALMSDISQGMVRHGSSRATLHAVWNWFNSNSPVSAKAKVIVHNRTMKSRWHWFLIEAMSQIGRLRSNY